MHIAVSTSKLFIRYLKLKDIRYLILWKMTYKGIHRTDRCWGVQFV